MNIIHIETKNHYKNEKENEMKTIPIIKRIYYENGEIKFEILRRGKMFQRHNWINKDNDHSL